ncbi:MAG TPA: HAD hydrolase-like protein, partial [Fimbriimonas sp.]
LDGKRDDKGELISYVLEQEALDASEVVMVGDRRYDVAGANVNGVRCVGALWGYGDRQELSSAGAWRLCHSPPELPGLLGLGERAATFA